MSEYDDWKQENDRWEAYLYPNGVLRNKLGITKAAKWHKMERDFVTARNTDLRPNTGLTTGNVGEELFAGTTSACAENTQILHFRIIRGMNYLRVRGEYHASKISSSSSKELPPRARRILEGGDRHDPDWGTTSACAENTPKRSCGRNHHRNYLRVRGEYNYAPVSRRKPRELPPRARRILRQAQIDSLNLGTTSACAENTDLMLWRIRNPQNYLRVRGEYTSLLDSTGIFGELPPRARRIQYYSA